MTNALYDVYRKEVFLLAKTMVIKHNDVAIAMNKVLREQGNVVSQDPLTWRYYKHLAGEYHETDELMYITNLDDIGGSQVLLTKDFLANNRVTRENYQYGSRFYQDLVTRFPKQESLILGMLNPVHINVALEAEDGTILHYDSSLVEEYEINLISQLQEFVYNYFSHRYIRDYAAFNNLYLGSVLSTLYTALPLKIMGIRLSNCHTDYVHSYHVVRFLNSNMDLGKYVPYMKRETMMFLYRNIRWIIHHAGHQYTFEKLVENVLTKQGIPIDKYDIIKTIDDADTILDRPDYSSDPYPNVRMIPRSINFPGQDDTSVFREVEDIVRKQSELLNYTEEQIIEYKNEIVSRMKPANFNELKTKVLESIMTDETDAVRYPLAEVLLNHWIYYSCTDKYLTNISLVNPATGEQLIISTKKAFLLYAYLIYTYFNQMTPPVYIEKFEAMMVFNEPKTTMADIEKVIDVSVVNDDLLTEITNNQIVSTTLLSTDAFYQKCVEIQAFMMKQFYLYDNVSDMETYAYLKKAAGLHYSNHLLDPVDAESGDKLWTDWLSENGIVLDGLLAADYIVMANKIVSLATGAGESTSRSVGAMHRAMIEMMEKLTSYSVQFLRTITNVELFPIDWAFGHYSRITQASNDNIWVDLTSQDVNKMVVRSGFEYSTDLPEALESFTADEILRYNYDADIDVELSSNENSNIAVNLDGFSFTSEDFYIDLSQAEVTDFNEYGNP